MPGQNLTRSWWRQTHIRIGAGVLMSLILFVSILAWSVWWRTPNLTPLEQKLVGNWALPEPDPRIVHVSLSGPMTNPLLIREFGHDRSYRVWVLSTTNPGSSRLALEGQWRVVNGMLRTEDFPPGSKRVIRDVWRRAATWTGLPLGTPRISGNTDVSIRSAGEKSLEITNPRGVKFIWNRLP